MTEWIREYLNDYLNKEFFTSRKVIESNPAQLLFSKYIHKLIRIDPNITINYMKVFYQNSSNLCGYHCLFYAANYIQYILTNDNAYYLWKMNSGKKFWKYYKIANYFLFNSYIDDEYIQKDLNEEGSLEREQLTFFIENQKDSFPIHDKSNMFHFHYHTIDLVCEQFSIDEDKALRIQKTINEIRSTNKRTRNDIYFFFIGITNHWLLYVIHCKITGEINHYVFDSCDTSTDVFDLHTKEEMNQYIEKISLKEQEIYKKKALTDYQKKSFFDWILDMKYFFTTFPLLFYNNNNDNDFLIIILSKIINQIIISYESSVNISLSNYSDHESSFISIVNNIPDLTEIILQIYIWLLSQYPPIALESEIIPKLTSFGLKEHIILIKLKWFISFNMKFIEQYQSLINLDDSNELFNKFLSSLKEISKVLIK